MTNLDLELELALAEIKLKKNPEKIVIVGEPMTLGQQEYLVSLLDDILNIDEREFELTRSQVLKGQLSMVQAAKLIEYLISLKPSFHPRDIGSTYAKKHIFEGVMDSVNHPKR